MTTTTGIAYAASTLHAPVEILGELPASGRVRVRTLAGGVGGWATAGKELTVDRALLTDIAGVEAPDAPAVAAPAPLSELISGDDYMQVLVQRQQAWTAANAPARSSWASAPLLEWFVEPGDEQFVQLPEPTRRPDPQPRMYRSAESLRAERDEVERRMNEIAGTGPTDGAAVNLSPYSRSRAARTAGRRRFAQLDRSLEQYTKLQHRRDQLNGRLANAEAREEQS